MLYVLVHTHHLSKMFAVSTNLVRCSRRRWQVAHHNHAKDFSMESRDELVPIPRDQWPTLRDLFLRDWPKHHVGFQTIQTYIDWVKIDGKIKDLEVLGLNDSWRENGTYIVLDRYQMFLYTMEDPDLSLKRALQLIDWNYSYTMACVDDAFHKTMMDVFESFSVEVLWDNPNFVYAMTKEKCLELDVTIPEGLYLRKLQSGDASIANQLWPLRCEGSEYFFKRLAAWNPSVGLFSESGELMAWCFCWPTGALGPLEVVKKHYRKGYGSIVLKALAKEVAKLGMFCYGTVIIHNVASNGMFRKAGFKEIGRHFYFRTRAKKLVEYGD